MHTLKSLSLWTVGLLRQMWWLPRSITHGLRARRHQLVLNALEAERLDRIRNPLKYLGK